MDQKPKGWSSDYGSWFELPSLAERYGARPSYPQGLFPHLAALAGGQDGIVLDAGCGTGDVARRLAPLVARVDAVDRSVAMLEQARRQGRAGNIRWIAAAIEAAPLEPPYTLVTAGESVHWFEWERVLPLFVQVLVADGLLALLERQWLPEPLTRRFAAVYQRHSANRDFVALDPVEELERRGFFARVGEAHFGPERWTPTLDEFLACHHSQGGFAIEKMDDATGFDQELAAIVSESVPVRAGRLQLEVTATAVWGRPLAPAHH